jgi:uncharacterized protein with von Willebrand factor type A (vWA) domain
MNHLFSKFINYSLKETNFEKLLNLFLQTLNIASGNVSEALRILTEIDRKYKISSDDYGIGDFIEDLKKNNYILENKYDGIKYIAAAKSSIALRKQSLEIIFGKLKNDKLGNHNSKIIGKNGDEITDSYKNFEFGDSIESIDFIRSLKNSQIRNGIENFELNEKDLEVYEKEKNISASTVLLIDISHSMILYGEDRITPAKNAALALVELIMTKYPKDTIDVIAFGDDAYPIEIKDIMYLQAGPFHTNLAAGLQLAQNILRRKKNNNKNIFLITDGKPSCIKEGAKYYKNSFGLDKKIVNKTLDEAAKCKKAGIVITTLMIARDPYLQKFVKEFTRINGGRAFINSLSTLGDFVLFDYVKNRIKKLK